MSLTAAREQFLDRALEQLAHDRRVAAVIISGSSGRGEADEWSDLDLNVVVDDEASPDFLSHPSDAEQFGDLVLWVDCSFNAVPGGSMSFSRYASEAGLVMVDWNASPLSTAQLTAGSRLLWSRPGVELPTFSGNLVELIDATGRRRPPPYSSQQRAEWELCMVHIATSRPPRGQDGRPQHRLIGLEEDTGPDPIDQLDGLRRHVEKLRPLVAPRAVAGTLDRLAAARRAVTS